MVGDDSFERRSRWYFTGRYCIVGSACASCNAAMQQCRNVTAPHPSLFKRLVGTTALYVARFSGCKLWSVAAACYVPIL